MSPLSFLTNCAWNYAASISWTKEIQYVCTYRKLSCCHMIVSKHTVTGHWIFLFTNKYTVYKYAMSFHNLLHPLCLLVLSSQAHLWASDSDNGDPWFGRSVDGISCCLPLSAQSFLIPSLVGLNDNILLSHNCGSDSETLAPKLLLALNSWVIFGSKSHGTHDHIVLSDSYGSFHTMPWALVSSPALSVSVLCRLITNATSRCCARTHCCKNMF
jgi:hypothetical protein